QLPFGWVCFSNDSPLSSYGIPVLSQLPFGWVCFSNPAKQGKRGTTSTLWSQLPFGWVCFSNNTGMQKQGKVRRPPGSQLPFGWVCFSNSDCSGFEREDGGGVSIAFRLGLFL